MKRWISFLIAAALIMSLSGCDFFSLDESVPQAEDTVETAPAEITADATELTGGEASGETSGGASGGMQNRNRASGENRGSGEASGEQEEANPGLSETLTVLATAEEVESNSAEGRMTALFELLGQTWYVAVGSADESFTVDGETVQATAVDTAKTLWKWSESSVEGETVYGTACVPYADFYYGELNSVRPVAETLVDCTAAEPELLSEMRAEGMYDAVTSATNSKWKMQSGTYTEANESGRGGKILGLVNFPIAVDAELLVNAAILSSLYIDYNETLASLVTGFCITEEIPAVYKTLYADGSLSAMAGETSELSATFSVSANSRYGDYQLNARSVQVSGTVYGVVLTDDTGAKYGLCHLENIWRNGGELAWYANETTRGRYLPYAALSGRSITEIRYLTSAGISVCSGLDLAIGG